MVVGATMDGAATAGGSDGRTGGVDVLVVAAAAAVVDVEAAAAAAAGVVCAPVICAMMVCAASGSGPVVSVSWSSEKSSASSCFTVGEVSRSRGFSRFAGVIAGEKPTSRLDAST